MVTMQGLAFFEPLTHFTALAVAILAVIKSSKNSFPPSTVIIEQYRPPIDRFIIGDYEFTSHIVHIHVDIIRITCWFVYTSPA